MYLQLHDGPDGFPPFTGRLEPLSWSYNPYEPGGPVINPGPFNPFHGCDPAQVYAEFVPQGNDGWKITLNQIQQGEKLWKDFQSIRAAAGTGSAPVFDAQGNITGYKQATKVEEALEWWKLGVRLGNLIRGSINAAEARRLSDDAQQLWDANKWGLQNLCTQSIAQLQINAQNCYDSLQWWLADQGKPGRSAGQKRVANRAVVLRQNALLLIVKHLEEKGAFFTPGQKGAAPVNTAAILAALAAFAFLRF